MASQHTPGNPIDERHQQHNRAVSFMLKLDALARAKNVKRFAKVADCAASMSISMQTMSEDFSGKGPAAYDKLLEYVYSAISNGLKQLSASWPEGDWHAAVHRVNPNIRTVVDTINSLCTRIGKCKAAKWYNEEYAEREPTIAVEAGFLQYLGPVIRKLLEALQPLQQSANHAVQQLTANQWQLTRLGALLLHSWLFIFRSWEGSKLTDEPLASTLETVTSLALTVLHITVTEVNKVDSSSSSSTIAQSYPRRHSGIQDDISGMWSLCFPTCIDISKRLMYAATVECCVLNSDSHSSSCIAAARAAATPAGVQRLMLLGVAVATAQLHRQQTLGSAASESPDGAVPSKQQQPRQLRGQSGYMHLLAALGYKTSSKVFSSAVDDLGVQADLSPCVGSVCGAVFTLYACFHEQQQDHNSIPAESSSAGSSSVDASSIVPQTVAQSVLQQLAFPVLHTLKDLILLLPDTDIMHIANILWVFSCVVQLVSQLPRPQAQQQQLLRWLLQPLYAKVCRVMSRTSQQHSGVTGAELSLQNAAAGVTQVLDCWVASTTAILTSVVGTGPASQGLPGYLTDILAHQPAISLTAFETVIRLEGKSNIKVPQQPSLSGLSAMLMRLLVVDDESCSVGMDVSLDQSCVQQQMISLICSRLKVMMVMFTAAQQPDSLDGEQLEACTCLSEDLQLIACMLMLHSDAQRGIQIGTAPAQRAADSKEQQLQAWSASNWVALLGRAVHAFAASMLQHPTPPSVVAIRVLESFAPPLSLVRQLAASVVDQDHHDGATAAGVRQPLKKLEQLVALVQSAVKEGKLSQTFWQQLLAQLQECGSSICAALPVKFCCNNPACVNLTQLSEQQLVAGKGSRCSGCKVARYCSRDCQLKHWKQHRKTCKTLSIHGRLTSAVHC